MSIISSIIILQMLTSFTKLPWRETLQITSVSFLYFSINRIV